MLYISKISLRRCEEVWDTESFILSLVLGDPPWWGAVCPLDLVEAMRTSCDGNCGGQWWTMSTCLLYGIRVLRRRGQCDWTTGWQRLTTGYSCVVQLWLKYIHQHSKSTTNSQNQQFFQEIIYCLLFLLKLVCLFARSFVRSLMY